MPGSELQTLTLDNFATGICIIKYGKQNYFHLTWTSWHSCAEWCTPGQFVCPNSQVCVDQRRLCDGARDCPYGDDEKQCVTIAQNEETAGDFPYNSEGN